MQSSPQTRTTKEEYKVSFLLTAGRGIPIYPSRGYGTDFTIVRIHSTQTSSHSLIFCENVLIQYKLFKFNVMELRNLRSFVLVAETSSFSIAASRCYLTQSAVSQHIKALEEELKCKLLIRNSHNAILTECGELLFAQAKEILKLSDDCIEQINALNNCITGELRIGVGSFIAPYIRRTAMTFMERYPNVKLSVEFSKACRQQEVIFCYLSLFLQQKRDLESSLFLCIFTYKLIKVMYSNERNRTHNFGWVTSQTN